MTTLGFIGLGRMGGNIAYHRLKSNNIDVIGYDIGEAARKELRDKGLAVADSYDDLFSKLSAPRRLMIMVTHQLEDGSKPVDAVLEDIKPYLQEGDAVIDLGNTKCEDTVRRAASMPSGVQYMGVGTSGGIPGAINGACVMIGGNRQLYEELLPAWQNIACETGFLYIGQNPGAGHDVKLTHNLVEYSQLQTLAEVLDFCRVNGISPLDAVRQFKEMPVGQYLPRIEHFLREGGSNLEDLAQKEIDPRRVLQLLETSLTQKIPLPTVSLAWNLYSHGPQPGMKSTTDGVVEIAHDALYLTWLKEVQEGLEILQRPPQPYDADLADILKVWQHGSILAAYLDIAEKTLDGDEEIQGVDAKVGGGDFGIWVADTARGRGVPIPITASILHDRFLSTQPRSWSRAMVNKMRNVFGGHAVEKKQ